MFDDDFNLFSKPTINAVHIQNNLGENSCYTNCMLHSFYYFKYFKSQIKKTYFSKPSPHIKLLSEFQKVLFNYNELYKNTSEVTVLLDPTPLKIEIANYFKAKERYQLNDKGDPIELLQFFFNIIHSYIANKDGSIIEIDTPCSPKCFIHESFCIQLFETMKCPKCPKPITLNYDNNYFIYEMYATELCKLILDQNLTHDQVHEKLVQLSKEATIMSSNFCETHKTEKMNKKLTCLSSPKYLLLHLVWSTQCPSAEFIQLILDLISFNVSIEDLFDLQAGSKMKKYELSGMILYWNSHYVSVFYDNGVWLLYDDQNIEQLSSWEMMMNHLLNNHYQPICLYYSEQESSERQEDIIDVPQKQEDKIPVAVNQQNINIPERSDKEEVSHNKKDKEKEEKTEMMKPIQISNPEQKITKKNIKITTIKVNEKDVDDLKQYLPVDNKKEKNDSKDNNTIKMKIIKQETESQIRYKGQSNFSNEKHNEKCIEKKEILWCSDCKHTNNVNDSKCANCHKTLLKSHSNNTSNQGSNSRTKKLEQQQERNKIDIHKGFIQDNLDNKKDNNKPINSKDQNDNYNQTINKKTIPLIKK